MSGNLTLLLNPVLSVPDVKLTFPLVPALSIPDVKLTLPLIPVSIPDFAAAPPTRDLPDAGNTRGEIAAGLFTRTGGGVLRVPHHICFNNNLGTHIQIVPL